jgi:hypothetical protein
MITEIYLEILALDSLYGVLSWYERCWLHLLSNGKQPGDVSERIVALYMIVKSTEWQIPDRKIGHDRLGQYYENGKWNDDEFYSKNHPEITRLIKQIKK